MMASLSRYSAVAVFIRCVYGLVLGAAPSPTVLGLSDLPILAPTKAPEVDLVRARLAKKAVPNICTEWTIPGEYGQPQCSNSETCLFTTSGSYGFEGCGQTSLKYNWVTECWNYGAQPGSAPLSQTYCPPSAPICGYFAFIFGEGITYSNLGCSTSSYEIYVHLVTQSPGSTTTSVNLQIAASTRTTTASTAAPAVETIPSTASQASVVNLSTNLPSIGAHASSSPPTGAIAGGIIGGIAAMIIACLSLFWFCIRKRSHTKAAARAEIVQETSINQRRYELPPGVSSCHASVPEIGGTPKSTSPTSTITPITAPYNDQLSTGNNYALAEHNQQHHPHVTPSSGTNSTHQCSELDPQNSAHPSISSVGTPFTVSPNRGVSGLGADDDRASFQPVPPPQHSQQPPQYLQPRVQSANELGGESHTGCHAFPQQFTDLSRDTNLDSYTKLSPGSLLPSDTTSQRTGGVGDGKEGHQYSPLHRGHISSSNANHSNQLAITGGIVEKTQQHQRYGTSSNPTDAAYNIYELE